MHFPSKIVLLHPFFSGFSAYFASTLGGVAPIQGYITNANTDIKNGTYMVHAVRSPFTNGPTGVSYGFMQNIHSDEGDRDTFIIQYFYDVLGHTLYQRETNRAVSSLPNTPWQKILTLPALTSDTASLSTLASALGGLNVSTVEITGTSVNLDDYQTTGLYAIGNVVNNSSFVIDGLNQSWGMLWVFKTAAPLAYITQIVLCISGGLRGLRPYYRYKGGDGQWSTWKQINITNLSA